MLTIKARRFIKRTGRNLDINGQKIGFNKSKVECFNCHKNEHFARECRTPKNQENKSREYGRKAVPLKNSTENALITQDGIRRYDWSYQAEEEHPTNFALMALTSLRSSSNSDFEDNVKSRSDKGYHAVPPPYIENYIPPKPDLMFIDEQVKSKSVDNVSNVSFNVVKTVESKVESVDVMNKTARETEDKVETPKQHKHYPRGNERNWSNLMSQRLRSNFKMINKACYVCGSFEHLHYVCDQRVVRPVWNNTRRVNHKNFANKMTHPHPKRKFIPQAILTKSGNLNIVGTPVNTVKPVNTADSKPIVNYSRPISNDFKRGYLHSIRPFNRHMTRNKCYLTDYEDYNGGFVSFGDGKGRISRKGKIKTGTLDFDDVYFYKELKYNLFIARIEAIRLFLAYASFKDYVVYQMDVKSTFLYGKIEEEVYVCQPLGFEDPDFPNKVYKVEKVLYGLHQALAWYEKSDGIFISQDKYVADILKKFDFSTVKTTSTLVEPNKALVKDAEAKDVDVYLYRSMIGSLIYLKGQPKLGLWYPKDSPFDLEAYSDSDYAGASLAGNPQ
nr:copia protein [Tanacetum cinerariifolium]